MKQKNKKIHNSQLEITIVKILNKEHIQYIREKTFSDLRKGKYRFDFYLPEYNICIECDGIQHFQQQKFFQKTKRDFQATQEHDRRKNSYCLARGIKLYRIPYFKIDLIKNFDDILNPNFLVTSRWHNDLIKEV